jgi:hypothetical protein
VQLSVSVQYEIVFNIYLPNKNDFDKVGKSLRETSLECLFIFVENNSLLWQMLQRFVELTNTFIIKEIKLLASKLMVKNNQL